MNDCSCTWTPCRCAEISRMSPEQRVAEQDRIAFRYLRRRADADAEQQRLLIAAAPATAFGMDGQTNADRQALQQHRPVSQDTTAVGRGRGPRGPRLMTCRVCGEVGAVHYKGQVYLHRGFCKQVYFREQLDQLRGQEAARQTAADAACKVTA